MQALPIFLDRLVDSVTAVVLSVTVVLFFGESRLASVAYTATSELLLIVHQHFHASKSGFTSMTLANIQLYL